MATKNIERNWWYPPEWRRSRSGDSGVDYTWNQILAERSYLDHCESTYKYIQVYQQGMVHLLDVKPSYVLE
jgi:hypothetical protein